MDVSLDPANRAAALFDAIASKTAVGQVQNQPSFRDCLQPRQCEPPTREPSRDFSSKDTSSDSNVSSDSQVADQSSTRTADAEQLEQDTSVPEEPVSVEDTAEEAAQPLESGTTVVAVVAVQVQLPVTSDTLVASEDVEEVALAAAPGGEELTDTEPGTPVALSQIDQSELVAGGEGHALEHDPSDRLDNPVVEGVIIEAVSDQMPVDETHLKQQPKISDDQTTLQLKATRLSKGEGEDQPLEIKSAPEARQDAAAAVPKDPMPQLLSEDSATTSEESTEGLEAQYRIEETLIVATTLERPTEPTTRDSVAQSSAEPAASNATSGVEGGETPAIGKAPPALLRGKQAQSNGPPPANEIDPAKFISRVAKAFQSAEQRGSEVRLRLHPSELGSLSIEVKVQEGVLTARVQAETSEARTALVDNLPHLRERLAEQGIRIDQFDVDLMDHSDHQPQQSREEQERRPSVPSPMKRPAEQAGESRRSATLQSHDSQGLNVIV